MVTIGKRSPVFARHGMVASSQPLATEIGLRILKQGGNAVDAAIAVAAALNLTEPCSTGIGGDCFLLYYDAATKQVLGLNGSGRSPAALTREKAMSDFADTAAKPPTLIPRDHGHAVTVPGTVAGWVDALDAWGTLPIAKVLEPVIELAKDGYPVSTITAESWKRGQFQLERGPYANELLIDGRAPLAGEIFKNPYLAACFEEIAAKGKAGFYEGRIAEAVVEMIQSKGGVMTLEDLKAHTSTFVTPIKTTFKGINVYEIPPNGQGITALLALNILEHLLPEDHDLVPAHNSAEYLHLLIEAMRLAFADAKWYVSDMELNTLPIEELLSSEYAKQRAALISKDKATIDPKRGSPALSCDTVSFQVVDGAGNAVSMVNSNYEGFGTGFVPRHTGFTLQNRGSNFCLDDPEHPNALAPRKRPYHTIIPAISTFAGSNDLHSTFTVMGGFMQPQGHVQVLCNLLFHKLNPQEAIDGARFCIDAQHEDNTKSYVFIEEGVHDDVIDELQTKYGHVLLKLTDLKRSMFGRGQIILRNPQTGVLSAGSDGRADGCAMGCVCGGCDASRLLSVNSATSTLVLKRELLVFSIFTISVGRRKILMASRVFHRTTGGPSQQKTKGKSTGKETGGQHGAGEAKSPQAKFTNQEPHDESKPPLSNTSAPQAVQLPSSSSSSSPAAPASSSHGVSPTNVTTALAQPQPPPLHPHHLHQQQHHPHVPVHRPSTSPLSHGHTSHAMILQMQRLRQAWQLTRSGRNRRRRHGTGGDDGNETDQISQHHHDQGLAHLSPPTAFKRRSSIFLDTSNSQPPEHLTELLASSSTSSPLKQIALVRKPSSSSTNNPNGVPAAPATASTATAISELIQENAKFDKALRGRVTLACTAGFSVRMSKIYHLMTIIRKIQSKERKQLQRVVFAEWKKLDHTRCLQYASHVIVANSFRFRFHARIRKKAAHVSILRKFLGGLSIDVQFAIAMKKIKRKIQLIQRWWRHVQLMVKAREEALYHKWINVETRLRLEYINQMPHLQRIFQQPSHAGGGVPGNANSTNNSSSDFALFDGSSTASGELSTSPLQAYHNYSNARWKPSLMVFRQGAFRFVLLTSASPMPTEIMAWKDKLERLVMTPTGNNSNSSSSSSSVFGSISGPSGGSSGALQLFSSSHNASGNFGTSVSEFVEVSMQSGILASNSHRNNLQSPVQSFSSLAALGGSFSLSSGPSVQLAAALTIGSSPSSRNLVSAPRGKLQARVRSIRQRNRMGVTVSEGELTYYVVDLLKDFPKVPTPIIWQTIRDKLREKRKSFRAEIYRYNLEMYHFHRHQEQTKHIHVLDKFKSSL